MPLYSTIVARGGGGSVRLHSAPSILQQQDSPVPVADVGAHDEEVFKVAEALPLPTKYQKPEDWFAAAEVELGQNLNQASEKLYMSGRKALDLLAAKCKVELKSHGAADMFMQFLVEYKVRGDGFGDLWFYQVNVAHSNFYNERLGQKRLERMFPEVQKFIKLATEAELTDKYDWQKTFKNWLLLPVNRGLNVEMQGNDVLAVWGS